MSKIKKSNQLAVLDPKSIQEAVEASMPAWVTKINTKEDMANSMYATGQEMLLVVIDTLQRYHNFSESEIKLFTKELEDVLKGVKEFEDHGLSMLSPRSVEIVGEKVQEIGIMGLLTEIAQTRLLKEKMTRAGMEYPVSLAATPFIKRLKEKNK